MTITVRTTTVVADPNSLKTKFKNLERTVGLFVVQISALRSAATRLSVWIQDSSDSITESDQIDLNNSLGAYETLIELIESHTLQAAKSKFSFIGRSRYLFDEATLRDYQTVLQNQIQALGFHLQILQL